MTPLLPAPLRRTGCPYPGLRPYLRDETDLFFGRDEQVAQVLGRLHEARFLAVVGTSGCGKSSLVYAGIIPALETYLEVTDGANLVVVALRPGDQPLRALSRALLDALDPARAGSEAAVSFLQADLRRGPIALVEALRVTPPPEGTHLLFLIDQFEEIFRYREEEDRDEADAFVALLLATAKRTDVAAHVVLTMRSDYLGDCAVFGGLPEAISASQFLTPRMTRDQRQKAIEGPALTAGGRVEPDLINRLLNDMDSGPDQLPLMQHVLMRLWLKAQDVGGDGAAGIELKLNDYEGEDIGGLAHALDLHADEAYAKLEPNQKPDPKRIAEVMFRLLSERDAGTHNEGRPRDTRRPTLLRTVAEVAGAEVTPADVARVAEAFRAPGLNFLTPPVPEPLESTTRLDVSHESLIRRWKRLQGWVDSEAKSAEIYRRLADSARLWRDGNSDLFRRIETNATLAWRKRERPNAAWAQRYGGDFDLAMRFLDESENECRREEIVQEKRRNARVYRARWIAAISLVGLFATLGLMGWAISERDYAESESIRAKTERVRADKARDEANRAYADQRKSIEDQKRAWALTRYFQLAALAKGALDKTPQLAALLALEAVRAVSIDVDRTSSEPGRDEKLTQSLRDGEELLRLALRGIGGRGLCGNRGPINLIAATSDGRRVVTAGNAEILCWDVPDGGGITRASPLRGPKLPLRFLTIPPGDRWIIGKDSANMIFLWRLGEGHPDAEPKALILPNPANSVSPSFDGRWLLMTSDETTLSAAGPADRPPARLWNLMADDPTAHEVDLRFGKDSRSVAGFSFDPKGRWLAIVHPDLAANCWDLSATGAEFRPVKLLSSGPGTATNVAISRDGRRLIVCLPNGKARVWELEHPERKPGEVDLYGPGEAASTMSTDFHGRWAVTMAWAPTSPPAGIPAAPMVRLWDLSDPDIGKHPVILGVLPDPSRPMGFAGNLVVSDDEKWLASFTTHGVIVWKLDPKVPHEAKPIIPFEKKPSAANMRAFAFSADGRRLLTGGNDGVVLRSGDLTLPNPFQAPLTLRGQDGPIHALMVSRDSRRLITGGADGTARSWDLDALSASADPIEVRGPDGATPFFSRDRHRLAFAGLDGSVRLWDLTVADPLDGPALLLAPQRLGASLTSAMAFSLDGPALLLAPQRRQSPSLLAWDRDNRWLMARGEGRPAWLWDLSAPVRSARVVDLGEFARSDQFLISADSHWMAASVIPRPAVGTLSHRLVRLWDLTPDGPPSRPIAVKGEQDAVAFVGRGHRLVTRRDGQYSLWDLASGVLPSGPKALAGQIPNDPASYRVTPDGRRLLLLRSKGDVPMWDLEDPAAPPVILSRSDTLITKYVGSLSFTPDGRRAIMRVFDGPVIRVFVWRLDGPGATLDPVEPPEPEGFEELNGVTGPGPKGATGPVVHRPKAALSFSSPDGRWLIDAGRGGKVRLWDLIRPDPFGSPALTFPDRGSLPLLPVSPFTADGRLLATAEGNKLHLWDLRGEEPTDRATIPLESRDQVRALAVDPTGRWVALAGSDNQLRLWELTSSGSFARTILQPAPGLNPWNGLFLSPGGRRVTAIGYDPVARVYRVPLDELREAARRAVGRNLRRDEWNRFFPGQDYHTTFESLPEPPPWSASQPTTGPS
ncbi:MAG: NACHT and WD repeat domain-containing protein [Isosphaerales bacterium]